MLRTPLVCTPHPVPLAPLYIVDCLSPSLSLTLIESIEYNNSAKFIHYSIVYLRPVVLKGHNATQHAAKQVGRQ